jgi:hypothetical protein
MQILRQSPCTWSTTLISLYLFIDSSSSLVQRRNIVPVNWTLNTTGMWRGVMFWLPGAYASYIFKYIFNILQNVKKKLKKLHVHLHVLHAHKVVAQ